MDDRRHSSSQKALDAQPGSEPAPIVESWRDDPPCGRRVATYCFHGHELNEGIAAAFRIMGIEAPSP
jgi:hypothetical protein